MKTYPILGTAFLCFLALLPGLPYGYFTLLRLAVCCVCIYSAVWQFEEAKAWLGWICILMALLFNPIFKIHLNRDIWVVVDVLTGAFLCVLALKPKH